MVANDHSYFCSYSYYISKKGGMQKDKESIFVRILLGVWYILNFQRGYWKKYTPDVITQKDLRTNKTEQGQ